MTKVKLFVDYDGHLEDKINEFIASEECEELIDIKFSATTDDESYNSLYALVLYKTK